MRLHEAARGPKTCELRPPRDCTQFEVTAAPGFQHTLTAQQKGPVKTPNLLNFLCRKGKLCSMFEASINKPAISSDERAVFAKPFAPVLRNRTPSISAAMAKRALWLTGACMLSCAALSVRAEDRPVASAVSQNGKVRAEILSLKRIEGDLVTLRFQLVNEDNKDFRITPMNLHLLDLTARRDYSAGLASNTCSAAPGQRTVCWATFAAPPRGTKSMTVRFYEAFDLVTGVPVTD